MGRDVLGTGQARPAGRVCLCALRLASLRIHIPDGSSHSPTSPFRTDHFSTWTGRVEPEAESYVLTRTPAASDAFGARVRVCEAGAPGEPTGHQINGIRSDSRMESMNDLLH